MRQILTVVTAFGLVALGALLGGQVVAHGEAEVAVKPLLSEVPGDLSGKRITMLEVTYPPGTSFQAHQHPGTVLAFVHRGTIRSQLGTDKAPVTYNAGDAWYEPPGARHVFSDNPSQTEPVTIIAILVGDDGADLVQPDVH